MAAAGITRRRLIAVAGPLLLVAVGVFRFLVPGQGHLFYIPITLLAAVGGWIPGLAAGLVAAVVTAAGLAAHHRLHLTGGAWLHGRAFWLITFPAVGLGVGRLTTRNRQLVERLRVMAETDPLTGLANGRRLTATVRRRLSRGETFALVILDVDGLKQINDRDGHVAGDELLRRLAVALRAAVRPTDLAARIGGDEFAVVARVESEGEEELLVRSLARALRSEEVSASIGIAVQPRDGSDLDALYRVADERLYRSKPRLSTIEPAARELVAQEG